MKPKKPAIFLDRDGTITKEVGYLYNPHWLSLIPGSLDALVQLKEAGFKLAVVTNQSGIERNYFGWKELFEANERLMHLLGEGGVLLDGIYVCPHMQESNCNCRKPKPGLIFKAALELGIDIKKSIVVGDKSTDVGLGRHLGLKAILVKTGFGKSEINKLNGKALKPDFIAEDLLEASTWILKNQTF